MQTWTICYRATLIFVALLILFFLSGCASSDLTRQAAVKANAEQVPQALSVADEERRTGRKLPDYPANCRRTYRAGVQDGERLDAAVLKYDRALASANNQIAACAGWYDNLKSGIAGQDGH